MAKQLSDEQRDYAATIVALFSVLIHSWQVNDFAEAARVRQELERIGVKVTLPRRRLPAQQKEVARG